MTDRWDILQEPTTEVLYHKGAKEMRLWYLYGYVLYEAMQMAIPYGYINGMYGYGTYMAI